MSRKVNWGILGCAGIAEKAFIPAVKESGNGCLYGIAARDPGRAEEWKGKFGFRKAFPNYRELVEDPAVEAVYNPLPNHLHAAWSIRAMRAGKHVLCEKPMAMNAAEVREMIQEAEQAGVLLMEGFMYKFHPQIAKALDLVRSGAAGEVRTVHSSFTFTSRFDRGNYRLFPEMGGGALYDVGCYPISLSRLIFEEEPHTAYARSRIDSLTGVDMTTSMLLDFTGERFALCDCSFESSFQSRLLAVGTKGILSLARVFSAKNFGVTVELDAERGREVFAVPRANMFTRMVEHFGEALLEGTSLLYPAQDAYANMRVIDACLESIRTGRSIEILTRDPRTAK